MNLRLRNGTLSAAMLVAVCATCAMQAAAATIVAPVTAFATSNFGPTRNDYSIENTIDQSGLSLDYVSGITDLNTYLASKPRHTSNANGNEWFSQDFSKAGKALSSRNDGLKTKSSSVSGNSKKATLLKKRQVGGFSNANSKRPAAKVSKKSKVSKSASVSAARSTSAITSSPLLSITYGFSALTSINGFVLWNEEFAGIGTTQLWSSIDGKNYTLLSTITPKPSTFAPAGRIVPYLAQVFSFDPTLMLYFKLLIFDCTKPAANKDSYRGCGIGEVAFSSAPPSSNPDPVVPVPAALPLFASAIGIFAWLRRRQANRI